jgi:hypothetical protein
MVTEHLLDSGYSEQEIYQTKLTYTDFAIRIVKELLS